MHRFAINFPPSFRLKHTQTLSGSPHDAICENARTIKLNFLSSIKNSQKQNLARVAFSSPHLPQILPYKRFGEHDDETSEIWRKNFSLSSRSYWNNTFVSQGIHVVLETIRNTFKSPTYRHKLSRRSLRNQKSSRQNLRGLWSIFSDNFWQLSWQLFDSFLCYSIRLRCYTYGLVWIGGDAKCYAGLLLINNNSSKRSRLFPTRKNFQHWNKTRSWKKLVSGDHAYTVHSLPLFPPECHSHGVGTEARWYYLLMG